MSTNHLSDGDLNPDVQYQLESLNSASLEINKLENHLQELRNTYAETLSKWSTYMSELSNKIGSSISKARPYFELKHKQIEIQKEIQSAVARYENAFETLNQAKLLLAKTESNVKLDDSSMEILNRSNQHIVQTKREMDAATQEHSKYLITYGNIESQINELKTKHKNDIKKSKNYFNYSNKVQTKLKEDKQQIEIYENKIRTCKLNYNNALGKLEEISNKIHENRNQAMLGPRGEGVGSENIVDEKYSKNTQTTQHLQIGDLKGSLTDQTEYSSHNKCRITSCEKVIDNKSTPIVEGLLKAASNYNLSHKESNMNTISNIHPRIEN